MSHTPQYAYAHKDNVLYIINIGKCIIRIIFLPSLIDIIVGGK